MCRPQLEKRFRRRGWPARHGVPDHRGDRVGRLVAAVERDEPHEAAQEQPRADQQHERERHLRDGQRRPRPVRPQQPEAARRLRTSLVQRAHQTDSRPLERRRRAEEQPDDDRQPHGEHDRHRVDAHLVEPRDLDRDERGRGVQDDGRRGQAEQAAAQAQRHALGQELPHQAAPAGAERRAHGQRPPPGHPAREKQPRDVDAGDQQHQHRRRRQRQQRGPIPAHHLLEQRNHADLDLGSVTGRRIPGRLRQDRVAAPLQDGAGLGRGLRRRHAGTQPPEHVERGHEDHALRRRAFHARRR